MTDWTRLADDSAIERTVKVLREHGIDATVVNNKEQAKKKVLELIPEGAEVFNVTSRTIDDTGLAHEINDSGRYKSIRKMTEAAATEERLRLRRQHLSPDYVIGSVHAVTEDGQAVIASNSGSQIPPYVYGAAHVIWVVGTQKIVKNMDDAFRRINEHALPLESERMRRLYGYGSRVSKLAIISNEFMKDRIRLIFVKEVLGF